MSLYNDEINQELQDTRRANRERIFDTLQKTAVAQIVITFDGYGDEGQIQGIEATDAAGNAISLPSDRVEITSVSWCRQEKTVQSQSMKLQDALETLCYGYLGELHPGWEDNEGCSGDFTIDVLKRTIHLECNQRYLESTAYAHTV